MQNFEKKYVDIKSGEKLAYIEQGFGETVLLLHGNMSSSVHMLPIIEQLSKTRRCVAVDMRGFGNSSYNKPFDSLAELAFDVKEFCDELNITRCDVIAWSAGGGVALELAAHNPKLVKSIFSIEGASHKGYPIFKKNAQGMPQLGQTYPTKAEMSEDAVQIKPMAMMMANKLYEPMKQVWNMVIYVVSKPNDDDYQIFLEETCKQRCLFDLDWALANFNMSSAPNFYRQGDNTIGLVTCPVALTSGDKDVSVPNYMVMENASALPQAKVINYVNCGHSPLQDCLNQLISDITAFIA